MQQIAWISTPCAVYAAAYAGDGRLWFGGGFWYGGGYLGCAERDGTVRWYAGGEGWSHASSDGSRAVAPAWGPMTVSGLWLAGTQQIVVSAWSFALHAHPLQVLALGDGGPSHAHEPTIARELASPATGVIGHDGRLWVRQLVGDPDQVLISVPAHGLDRPGGSPASLASRRLVGIGRAAITGYRRGLLLGSGREARVIEAVPAVGQHPQWGAGDRTRSSDDELLDGRSTVVLGTRDGPSDHASAITADDAGTRILAGFADGAVAWWSATRDDPPRFTLEEVRPAHRFPISAACRLPSGDEVTADRGGWLHRWRGGTLVGEWRVDSAHSPRTLAADPTSERLAIGCKHGRGGPSPGGIAIVQL